MYGSKSIEKINFDSHESIIKNYYDWYKLRLNFNNDEIFNHFNTFIFLKKRRNINVKYQDLLFFIHKKHLKNIFLFVLQNIKIYSKTF